MAIIVVALHGLLFLIAWCLGEQVYRRSVSDDASMTWILTRPLEPLARSVDSLRAQPSQRSNERPTVEENTRESDTTVDSPARSPRQIDWGAHAAFNARRAVEDGTGERYRNLGPRKPGPPPEPAIPSIFEPEPDVRGEEGLDVNGDPVVRLNKYCYQELEKRLPTARDYVDPGRPLIPKCMFPIGKPEPRGDLFEHLKRDHPLPEQKSGATGEMPERKPENESR
jgi:hypothetical protein